MKQLIQIIKRLNELKSQAGRDYLVQGIRIYSCDDKTYLKLVTYYRDGIELLCSLITKKDLKALTWFELCVLVDATNTKAKLRRWIFERQKTFPDISDEEHYRQKAEFEEIYKQPIL